MAALIRPRVGLLICNYTTYIFLYLQIFLLGFLILVVIASTASREKYSHWVQQWTYKSFGPFSPCQDLSTHCRRHHKGAMPTKHFELWVKWTEMHGSQSIGKCHIACNFLHYHRNGAFFWLSAPPNGKFRTNPGWLCCADCAVLLVNVRAV